MLDYYDLKEDEFISAYNEWLMTNQDYFEWLEGNGVELNEVEIEEMYKEFCKQQHNF